MRSAYLDIWVSRANGMPTDAVCMCHSRQGCFHVATIGGKQGVSVGLQEDLLVALVGAQPPVLQGAARIIPARVPIIKCTLAAGEPHD